MHKVVVHINSTLHHFSQLLAGLEFLHQHKKIILQYNLDLGKFPGDIFLIEVNGKNVFFDLADNNDIYKNFYDQSDFYVKRMLLKSDYQSMDKLIPYGLYYPIYYNNFRLRFLFLQNSSLLKYSIKYWKFISWSLNVRDSIAVNELSMLESKPSKSDQIIFRSRLWNPANNKTEWKQKERIFLNEQRIEINRLLKKQYPLKFKGGILADSYSNTVCPDILIPEKEYHRKQYLNELKTSSIGIVNQGLEDSIGAKMGEYVSNSLSILTTSIAKYKLQGDFLEGHHYLSYNTAEECLNLTNHLIKEPKFRKNIQYTNEVYYKEYLHPAKKIETIFSVIDNNK